MSGGGGGVSYVDISQRMASWSVERFARQAITIHLIARFINCYEEKKEKKTHLRDLRGDLGVSSSPHSAMCDRQS